ncbi:GerW family sporulation protein [Paenibacillus eucommiae]|uniref:Sporulation protein YtfJ n=1 Tax=Paenibacillus eucommiae TaxID=1355755 RepID=A0ABS4IN63_9BACL|nr:GerW family sporulation protein [Paenibacillus eucommiae]MBP1988940.1 sporulation protein YtfJ [Paenibacillus eucommiae]
MSLTQHPIEGLMKVAMENIKEMVDVNTIVGDPVETPDGSVIMPISKVGFGFAAGGSEFVTHVKHDGAIAGRQDASAAKVELPFGGGSGGGVSITPIAFLVVGKAGVKVVPLDNQTHILERLIDSAPQVAEKIQSMIKGMQGTSTAHTMDPLNAAQAAPNNQDNPNFIV